MHWALVDDMPPGHMNISLTEAREAVHRSRRSADVFHSYDITSRDGTPIHVVYAHYLPGRTDVAFGGHDVTYLYEIATEAVAASFGLAPRPTPSEAA
jgi:hypothetical protein